jgi:hypothetical protein
MLAGREQEEAAPRAARGVGRASHADEVVPLSGPQAGLMEAQVPEVRSVPVGMGLLPHQ